MGWGAGVTTSPFTGCLPRAAGSWSPQGEATRGEARRGAPWPVPSLRPPSSLLIERWPGWRGGTPGGGDSRSAEGANDGPDEGGK